MPQPVSDTLAPRTRLALGLLALLLFFGGLGSYPLLEPDEGRYAEIPREMLARGDFVTPRLNGVLYFEKPPLYYWLNAAALSLPGRPEVLCRPSPCRDGPRCSAGSSPPSSAWAGWGWPGCSAARWEGAGWG